MESFCAKLKDDFTTLNARSYVKELRSQIDDKHLPGDKCLLPSFINALPTGQETGDFLALDLGGSTFRAAIVRLSGKRKAPCMLSLRSWKVEEQAKVTHSDHFFDWLASRVAEVVSDERGRHTWRCGLAFSFPVQETGINTGKIMLMGKGYSFTDDVGNACIKDKLDRAFARRHLKIELVAIVNDSVATMLSNHYRDERTKMALILGTGCNSSLSMSPQVFSDSKLAKSAVWLQGTTQVLVNAEMSMFGRDLLPWTKYDLDLDTMSTQPGYQTLEQFTSGRYMGELVRLIIVDACHNHGLFQGVLPLSLQVPFAFETRTMSFISPLNFDSDLSAIRKLLDDLHPKSDGPYSADEASFVRDASRLVASRSALLIAASMVALSASAATTPIRQQDDLLVAYCGTVIECYPGYVEACQAALDDLGSHLKLVKALDSGLLGAAVTAALFTRPNPSAVRSETSSESVASEDSRKQLHRSNSESLLRHHPITGILV